MRPGAATSFQPLCLTCARRWIPCWPKGVEELKTTCWRQESIPVAATQVVNYLAGAREALGCIPTRDRIVLERFFDDTGDMHLVVHAPLGSTDHAGLGPGAAQAFLPSFQFRIAGSGLEDSLILSLGETHSFETRMYPPT